MGRRVDILGERFTMLAFDESRWFSLPCIYLMVHEADGNFIVHYVGQTSKLNQRYASHHQLAAAKARGATHVLVLTAPNARDRREFETMLRWYYRPPLNAEAVPTHMQAWRAAMHCCKADVAELARAAHMSDARALTPAWTSQPKAAQG